MAVRFLRKLGASKETKMSLSGELSWPFSEEIEVRFVISFITDIITRQNATNFGGNERWCKEKTGCATVSVRVVGTLNCFLALPVLMCKIW